MSIKIITSSDPGYMTRAEKILEIYNESSTLPYDEVLNLNKPESTRIIYSDNDSGGVLLDHHSDQNIWRVMFAGFEPENRGKGALRDCMALAKANYMDVALVEVNNSAEFPAWKKLGYVHFGSMGMCMTLGNRKLDFINYNAFMA